MLETEHHSLSSPDKAGNGHPPNCPGLRLDSTLVKSGSSNSGAPEVKLEKIVGWNISQPLLGPVVIPAELGLFGLHVKVKE